MKAPFNYFGGKSSVAAEVWRRFGKVEKYVEPFFGSGGVLLNSPYIPDIEVVNDLDGYVANFWRATKYEPESVIEHASMPFTEHDWRAWNEYLIRKRTGFFDKILADPYFYDSEVAGMWAWGLAAAFLPVRWLADGAKSRPNPLRDGDSIFSTNGDRQLNGIRDLSQRLKRTRVGCGDWSRVATSPRDGVSGIFLDPPYTEITGRNVLYQTEDFSVGDDVHNWALEHGDDPAWRIAVCGHIGEYEFPGSWEVFSWHSNGAFEKREREVIWFSTHCLDTGLQETLF